MSLDKANENKGDKMQQRPALRELTAARIGIGRSGGSLTTAQILDFDLAHARARDAVSHAFDGAGLKDQIRSLLAELQIKTDVLELQSMAADKATYLKRPDFGRRLSRDSIRILEKQEPEKDIGIIISDGLSAQAAVRQVPELLAQWLPKVRSVGLSMAPIMIAPLARVGISDHVGEIIKCRSTVILLGERPGLATPESLGAYVTFEPRLGRSDADRNCISNIHAYGMCAEVAATLLQSIVQNALKLGLGGVRLSQEMAEPGGCDEQAKIVD